MDEKKYYCVKCDGLCSQVDERSLCLTCSKYDIVNNPSHYTSHPSGVECIQITEHMNFNLGNALKYIWRADLKHNDGGIEDLNKAEFYIKREIHRRQLPTEE